ncbi:MAG TPA: efflux RND transporter periplasmic adaptor subunit [Xanthobacteraceae bacterium]|nr:efflux RND transporter periplasmic adaptor subunit [Xanthobacteraceae bacterium]
MQSGNYEGPRKRMSGCGFSARNYSCARAIGAAALLLAIAAAVPAGAQQAPAAAIPVGTVYAERQPISNIRDFVGRVEATDRVEVRARVKGYLDEVLFKEGDIVKKGAPLYRIEKGLFQAAVEQAQGALERTKAAKTLTQIQLQRAQELLEKNAGTAVARDQALAADQQAQGAILSDQANLDTANINLGYTDITSPISGKISKTNVTIGNVVGPDTGMLTLIVSQDPMYISFPVSQRELLQAQLSGRATDLANIKIKIRFADGSIYGREGAVNFIDVSVDRATDTVLARATMPNPDGALIDGQLISVALEAGAPQDKVVVPQAALIADQQGIYVFAVEDGKAIVKRIKVGGESGTNVVVEDGLKGGEQIVVEGLQSLRPGQPVQAAPAATSLNRS